MSVHCENCKYWQLLADKVGMCRYYPPVVDGDIARLYGNMKQTLLEQGWWPRVSSTDWCGYFKERTDDSSDA